MGTWALSQVLALRKLGHEVRVISPVPAVPLFLSKLLRRGSSASCPSEYSWDGVGAAYIRWPVYPVGPLGKLVQFLPNIVVPIGWICASMQFSRAARSFSPDVVFGHHAAMGGYVASKLARKLRIPCFIADHSFGELELCKTVPARLRHYKATTRGIHKWIAVSTRMERIMRDILPKVPSATILNGADKSDSGDSVLDPVRRTQKVVLCVSHFYKRKNIPLLVRAFDIAVSQHKDSVLQIVGDGDNRDEVIEAISRSSHKGQIVLMGRRDHREVLQLIAQCTVFVLIGVNEPFGVVLAEAMLAGRPIIYCEDGGISDVAVSGVHGISVRPNDLKDAAEAIDRLLGNPELSSTMGKAAYDLAHSKLTWERNAQDLSNLFELAAVAKPAERPI
jgi:glycosyltransferase involved in cell wall biosynthesis